jgi:aspartate/methionine/tyrosine aminotransferase
VKIRRFDMEDWLNDHAAAPLNLAESGCEDFHLAEYLSLCGAGLEHLGDLWLGNNDTRGSARLREAIAACYERVDLSEVLVANGTSEALFAFFNELLEPGDEVLVPVPAFQCLHEVPRAIGCRVRELPLLEHEGHRLDLDRLAEAVTDETALLVINTPQNPLGFALDEGELRRVGEIAAVHDAHLLFDEHYRFLPLGPGTEPLPSGYDVCRPIHAKTWATGSMIKCFGVVGIRIGWLLGDTGLLARCRDFKDYLSHTIPLVTDRLAALGLEHLDAIVAAKKRDILPNLEALEAFMARRASTFDFARPEGGVVCFPRLRPPVDAAAFCRRLVTEEGVSLLPGSGFGVAGHVRINFGVGRGRFAEALTRIEGLLSRMGQ